MRPKNKIDNSGLEYGKDSGFLCSPFSGGQKKIQPPAVCKLQANSKNAPRRKKRNNTSIYYKNTCKAVNICNTSGNMGQISVRTFENRTTLMKAKKGTDKFKKMEALLKEINKRRDYLYLTLSVPRKTIDNRFNEYIKTGRKCILKELERDYPKKIRTDKYPLIPNALKIANDTKNKDGLGRIHSYTFGNRATIKTARIGGANYGALEAFLIVANQRRNYLYKNLAVPIGTTDYRFNEYIKNGSKYVLEQLIEDYPK